MIILIYCYQCIWKSYIIREIGKKIYRNESKGYISKSDIKGESSRKIKEKKKILLKGKNRVKILKLQVLGGPMFNWPGFCIDTFNIPLQINSF